MASARSDVEREVHAAVAARLLSSFDDPIKRVSGATRALFECMLVERRLKELNRV